VGGVFTADKISSKTKPTNLSLQTFFIVVNIAKNKNKQQIK